MTETPPAGTIALMGSGEFTATMVETHKALLTRSGRAAFLDTPAGFQPNAPQIAERAVAYFRDRVGHPLAVVSLPSARVPAAQATRAYAALEAADYVLVGPGSPSYAVRQWRDTPVPDILVRRVRAGACLVAASAAALTVGRLTLPVYEIYKVGEPPHWIDGVDVLGAFGFDVVVVPHWNNAEGGTHDTRYCYMGADRFRHLEAALPPGITVLGVDEHTACVLDLAADVAEIRGLGRVTVRRDGRDRTFGPGDPLPLGLLRGDRLPDATLAGPAGAASPEPVADGDDPFWGRVHDLDRAFGTSMEDGDTARAVQAVLELDRVLWDAVRHGRVGDELADAREVYREMIALLGARAAAAPPTPEAAVAPVVERVLSLRDALRARRAWAEADRLRDLLADAGIAVEDTPGGARWRVDG